MAESSTTFAPKLIKRTKNENIYEEDESVLEHCYGYLRLCSMLNGRLV
jgi:hypothetical protein